MAMAFLTRLGCIVVASEVSCPISRFRVDVAGWCEMGDQPFARRDSGSSRATLFSGAIRPPRPPASGLAAARTIIIECKQSRADFLRDDGRLDALLEERQRLRARQHEIEETLVKRYEPHLRRKGSSLFADCEEWDFESSRLAAYRRILGAIKRLDQQLHGETKFCLLSRYRLADRLYIVAPSGLIRPRELPTGWGLLECRRVSLRRGAARVDELSDLPIHETVSAPALGSPEHRRVRLLRNMAVAATRNMPTVLAELLPSHPADLGEPAAARPHPDPAAPSALRGPRGNPATARRLLKPTA